mgnify:CR=1 FL=1
MTERELLFVFMLIFGYLSYKLIRYTAFNFHQGINANYNCAPMWFYKGGRFSLYLGCLILTCIFAYIVSVISINNEYHTVKFIITFIVTFIAGIVSGISWAYYAMELTFTRIKDRSIGNDKDYFNNRLLFLKKKNIAYQRYKKISLFLMIWTVSLLLLTQFN